MIQSVFSTVLDRADYPPPGLCVYAQGARAWRPELVPHITRWLNALPAATLARLSDLRVSDVGGLIAVFDGAEPLRQVRVEFDSSTEMTVRCIADSYDGAVPVSAFEAGMIDAAARRAAALV